jgi:hypothetical protein
MNSDHLLWFIDGHTQFMTSWHAKMSLALTEPIENVLCLNLHTTSKHAPQTYQTWKVFCTWPYEFATCKPKLAMVEICGFGDLLVDICKYIENGNVQ